VTPPPPRDYQVRAIDRVRAAWTEARRVVLVMPTGGGKTRTGGALVEGRTLWLAHRIELLDQAAGALRALGHDVGIVSPRHPREPAAPVQVASLDTLVARSGVRPPAELVILDECHHAAAETYSAILAAYPEARHLGLTATPQRSDGRPLGDHYDRLVVGAQYSELTAAGHLVRCRVASTSASEGYLGSDLAQQPLDAWRAMPEGPRPTFAFAASVAQAHKWAAEFVAAGIPSAAIDGETPAPIRDETLTAFRAGEIAVLWNVYVLTEGVDVPAASCVLLARGVSHAGPYLQMVGRVLRPAPGKVDARLLDLSGAVHVHGLPTADREYALDGRPIRISGEPLKNCPQCGACIPAAQSPCPECGYVWPEKPRRKPKIWDIALQWEVDAAGGDLAAVSDEAKRREWARLVREAERRDWSLGFVRREWSALFGAPPPDEWAAELSAGAQVRELRKLLHVARARGYRDGWVRHRFRAHFGRWPTAALRAAAEGER